MDDIDEYEPKDSMLQALKVNFNDESLIAAEKDIAAYLQTQQLNRDNVCMVLKLLLSIEDISTMQTFAKLMETDRIVEKIEIINKNKKDVSILYKVKVTQTKVNPEDVLTADIDELVLVPKASLLASPRPKHLILEQFKHEHENISSKEPWILQRLRHVGLIKKVERSSITFTCNSSPDFRKFKVIYRSNRIPFRLMYEAIDYLKGSSTIRNYLFPLLNERNKNLQIPNVVIPTAFKLINESIATNVEQLQAVKQILAGPNPLAPYIVFGPPGEYNS